MSMRDLFGKISEKLNISGRDAKIFIVSLLLAFSIWLIHNLSLNYSETVRIPISARCDIDGHAYKSSNSAVVLARCRARGFNLIQLKRGEKKSPVPVAFAPSDMHKKSDELYYVTSDGLNRYATHILGAGAKLESFISDTIVFRFPFENHKRVPVQPVYSMSFRPQYINVAPLKVSPDSVTIYGEPFHLSGIDRVFTGSISLSDLSSQTHGEVKLDDIKGVRFSAEKVRYSLDVTRYVEIDAKMPIYTANVPKGRTLIVYPTTADVIFRCVFPVTSNPAEEARICIDYNEFVTSLKGQCIPTLESVPEGVISWTIRPEIFDCIESSK